VIDTKMGLSPELMSADADISAPEPTATATAAPIAAQRSGVDSVVHRRLKRRRRQNA
jgi:hypothetical protein